MVSMNSLNTCPLKQTCATYTRPMRLCKCLRERVDASVIEGVRALKTDVQIANALGISTNAVIRAVRRVKRGYGATNRSHLLLKIHGRGA
jgi:hypothetical protein